MEETRNLPGNYIPLIFDVTDEAAIKAAAKMVEDMLEGATLGALINNAGLYTSDRHL